MYIYQVLLPPFMRNKMITLCPTSYEIAQKMPNFSGWVRSQLLKHTQEVRDNYDVPKNKPPKHQVCKHCRAIGDHWSLQCPTLVVSE